MYVLQLRRIGCGNATAETEGPLDFHALCPFGRTETGLACLACTHHFERLEHARAVDAVQARAIKGAL